MNFFQTSLILATVVVSTMAMFETEHEDSPVSEFGAAPMTDDFGAGGLTGNIEADKVGVSHSLLFLKLHYFS